MEEQELEFTIEPFVEGQPGPHVRAAVAAVKALGVAVEFGPFGSSCDASGDTMPAVVAAIVQQAFANGATHVSMHVSTNPLANDAEPTVADADNGVAPAADRSHQAGSRRSGDESGFGRPAPPGASADASDTGPG